MKGYLRNKVIEMYIEEKVKRELIEKIKICTEEVMMHDIVNIQSEIYNFLDKKINNYFINKDENKFSFSYENEEDMFFVNLEFTIEDYLYVNINKNNNDNLFIL